MAEASALLYVSQDAAGDGVYAKQKHGIVSGRLECDAKSIRVEIGRVFELPEAARFVGIQDAHERAAASATG